MQINFPKCLMIELNRAEREKKNESTGKYEKTGQFDNKAVVYPFGQAKYPALVLCNAEDKDMDHIKSFAGKLCSITVDMIQTAKGAFYTFLSAEAVKAS